MISTDSLPITGVRSRLLECRHGAVGLDPAVRACRPPSAACSAPPHHIRALNLLGPIIVEWPPWVHTTCEPFTPNSCQLCDLPPRGKLRGRGTAAAGGICSPRELLGASPSQHIRGRRLVMEDILRASSYPTGKSGPEQPRSEDFPAFSCGDAADFASSSTRFTLEAAPVPCP